ncbi:MAG: hypothetical protein JKY37_34940 [Nannocystaceae bacterium]|nr:hypothetical protein [Nannocystaceae bacterium]
MGTWTKHKVPKTRHQTFAAAGVDWGQLGDLNDDRRFKSLSLKDARTFAFSGLQWLFVTPSGEAAVEISFVEVNDGRRVGKVIDLDSGTVRRTFSVPEQVDLHRSAFSADGRWLTLVGGNSVLLYDLGGA